MIIRTSRTARRGFTLVELLAGMLISALIIGAAYSTYLAASGAWEQSRSRSTNFQQARAALAIMERAIQSAVPPGENNNAAFTGESYVIQDTEHAADQLSFTCTAGVPNPYRRPRPDLYEVTFFLDISPEFEEPSLFMRRRPYAMVETTEEFPGKVDELAVNVLEFDLEYYDGIEFVEEWLEESLPEAIRITLVMADFSGGQSVEVFTKSVVPRVR